jgi:hypothetical protein
MDRRIVAALALPLEDFCRATGYFFYGLGALLGAIFGGIYGSVSGAILFALPGGLLGIAAGVIANFIMLGLLFLIPHPFAWLARSLGYAR